MVSEQKHRFNITLSNQLYDSVNEVCEKLNITKSELIEEALNHYFHDVNDQAKKLKERLDRNKKFN